MQDIILAIINRYGYIGVFLLITLENLFPPIPSEVILTFGGFMTTFSNLKVGGVVLAATLGSVFGAIVLYNLGRVLNIPRLERLCGSKWGRMMGLRREDVRKAEKWFDRYGGMAVLLCRFVPIARTLISIPAGSSGMKLGVFLPLTILGTLIWNSVLVYLGRLAGHAWETIAMYFNFYSMVAAAFLLLAALLAGVLLIKRRFLS
ncbi:DedA family protein [Thermanaeromonas sp. C210]|uniref:DedA family protein n=1 Tax=Thermanaeromonas sp. C210 TaxID=2731925 RepID=UPI00155C83E8|nr:DedA family protein [Thermanaeromonas sp. C210]GFN23891.1 alkaline phosphatase-like protein [Thermanaeromonas sp. C210]